MGTIEHGSRQGGADDASGLAFSRFGKSLVSTIMSMGYYLNNLCVVIAVVLMVGCKRSNDGAANYFTTPFQDESQFIVETIVSDLAEQVFYARYHQLPNPKHFSVRAVEKPDSPFGAPVYQLQIALKPWRPDLKIELKVNGPIWSPDVYQGVAAALAKKVGLETAKPKRPADTALLLGLTDGKAITIEKENEALSEDLEGDFSNPALHEEAAVLLGAFTLREHSGDFYEIRSPLCRMTAHLAMAQFLAVGRPPSVNGRVAEAMLFTLMNNQIAALEKLGGIETNDEAVAQWVRTLQADNTSDYRPLAESRNLSPIERIAWFQAFVRSVDTDIAWEKLADDEKLTPDFTRTANEASYSVGTGHQLVRVSLPLELKEIASVYKLSQGQAVTQEELASKLNEMPARCFATNGNGGTKVRVIDWGQWAMFFERQLGHAIQHNFDFLENKWGVPDKAQQFSTNCDQAFGALRLYPFVRRFNCTNEASYHTAVDDGFRVTVATPQLTPAECWNYLCYRGPSKEVYKPNSNPHLSEWHKHNPPPGTAYNPRPRFDHRSLIERPDANTRVDTMHTLAPYDRNISYNLIRIEYKKQPTYEQCQEVYKLVLPYATYAMAAVADTVQDQPDRYEELMSRAAALDPARYYNLGDYFRARQMEDKAAKYFEKGNDLCSDSVKASYYASWLVKYYLKKGETQKAQSIADKAGGVYSAVGLEAKAEFFEATGKYDEAFEWYAKEEKRYDKPDPLISFCIRYKAKAGDTRFDAELNSRVLKLFPKGIEKVDLKDFQSAPADGVLLQKENDLVSKARMKTGDIIVAVNGIRVHNLPQYLQGRETSMAPEMTLIVWQGNQYREIKASPPNHRFGVDMGDYPAK
jgi:tetratricopeptide (TPR) repeat protein